MILILMWLALVASVVSDAYADAKIDILRKRLHVVELLKLMFIVTGFVLPLIFIEATIETLGWSILGYVLVRIGFFNLTYNKTRGLNYKYVGNTDGVFDKVINKLPNAVVVTIYIISIFASGVILHQIIK